MGIALHRDAVLAAIVEPDDGDAFIVGFTSADSLCEFIAEMNPHEIEYAGVSYEDAEALRAMLSRAPDDRTH